MFTHDFFPRHSVTSAYWSSGQTTWIPSSHYVRTLTVASSSLFGSRTRYRAFHQAQAFRQLPRSRPLSTQHHKLTSTRSPRNGRLQRHLQSRRTRKPNLSRVARGGDGKSAPEQDGHRQHTTPKRVEPASGQFGTLARFILGVRSRFPHVQFLHASTE